MKRRDLIVLAGGMMATPFPCAAQSGPPRIGLLYSGSPGSAAEKRVTGSIKQGFADNGLAEGRDYVFDVRYANGDYTRFPAQAHCSS